MNLAEIVSFLAQEMHNRNSKAKNLFMKARQEGEISDQEKKDILRLSKEALKIQRAIDVLKGINNGIA
jgi:predicted transcriptional regulator